MSTVLQESPGSSSRPGVRAGLRGLLGDTVRRVRGHDLVLHSAAVTFYAGIAIVPVLLLALWLVSLVIGDLRLDTYADRLAAALPDTLGAPPVVRALVEAAAHLTPLTALVALLPASLYGEGLRRGLGSLFERREQRVGWRGRLLVLPLFVLAPPLTLLVLAVTPLLAQLLGSGDTERTALGIYVSFLVDWIALSVPLTYIYRVVAPTRLSWRAAAWGGFATGSFLSGFVQGFILFLALPLDLGAPFGGFRPVGAMVAVGLWLWLLHILVLVGYELAARIDARGGTPWHAPRSEGLTEGVPGPA